MRRIPDRGRSISTNPICPDCLDAEEATFFENSATGFVMSWGTVRSKPERSTSWEVGADRVLLSGAATLGGAIDGDTFLRSEATLPAVLSLRADYSCRIMILNL
jgi:hypothetical protein